MSLPRFIVFGDALTDFIRQPDDSWHACPGGAGWNLARVGARLGLAGAFAGAISPDRFGRQLFDEAQAAGLDMRFTQMPPRSPLLAMVTESNPPQYFFVGDDSADLHFDPDRLPDGWMAAVDMACFGGISLTRQPLADRLLGLAQTLAARGVHIAFDPNFRLPMRAPAYRPRFEALAGLCRYMKVSDEDLTSLFPGLNEAAALLALRDLAPRADILVTRGAAGMTWRGKDGRTVDNAALPVVLADTVGCGDAAFGGWLACLTREPDATPARQLAVAAASAACCAAHTGSYAPSWQEAIERLAG
ncbi:carbohydrate kinase family protein [Paludibacterium purpuratum]|uniref:Fructokinase n=1 Tax=Paludibacterium purpuratum TaxID=1144873 RepID=A0A4R7AYW2_9NEIS|nr:carbohydrate kinase [Paludibacterium purpuratum]TDR73299.1 fructokinase [Paludibacterium purpuratum]